MTDKSSKIALAIIVLTIMMISLLSFIPFLLITILYVGQLKHNYLTATARRINDISMIRPALKKCILWSALWSGIGLAIIKLKAQVLYSVPIWLFWFWFNTIMARWLAVVYFGVVVDKENNTLYFRQDQLSYDFLDYVTLKFFRDLEIPVSVKISDIEKVSKQYGDYTYIIGKFGSHRIMFSNKMKRDECIHVIKSAGNSQMLFEFDLG